MLRIMLFEWLREGGGFVYDGSWCRVCMLELGWVEVHSEFFLSILHLHNYSYT